MSWERESRRVMATPNLREGVVSVIDVASWKIVGQVPALGPGFVFDAQTPAEVKRIPMKKPIGKYNVHNKIMRSEGTSP